MRGGTATRPSCRWILPLGKRRVRGGYSDRCSHAGEHSGEPIRVRCTDTSAPYTCQMSGAGGRAATSRVELPNFDVQTAGGLDIRRCSSTFARGRAPVATSSGRFVLGDGPHDREVRRGRSVVSLRDGPSSSVFICALDDDLRAARSGETVPARRRRRIAAEAAMGEGGVHRPWTGSRCAQPRSPSKL